GLVCADPDDFKEFPGSVIFAKADDVNNGIRTANWSAVIEEDALVEVAEDARVKLTFADFKVGMVSGNEHVITSYDFTVQDGNSLSLQYECKAGDGTQTSFNEGDTVSCSVSWSEDIASNALPIALTHELLPCGDGDICASNDDFDDGFLSGVVVGMSQASDKNAIWNFGIIKENEGGLVEALETANIAVLAKSNDPARAINIATSDPVLTFTIQDGDTLTLDTSCVKNSPEEGAGADSGLRFTERDTVECTITTNMVAGNVPDFDLKAELADSCAAGLVCADPDDFKEFSGSVIFAKADDVNNGIRTANWSAVIEEDA